MNKLLNNRVAVWISFIVALLSKFILIFNYRIVDGDKIIQVAGAVNILRGNGYTLPVVNAQDFVTIQHIRIHEWPPLYSYLLVPLLKITRLDIDTSCYILEIISYSILLGFFWRLLKQLRFSYIIQVFLLLLLAFYIRGYFTKSFATDLLAAGFFLAGLSFFLSFINSSSRKDIFCSVVFLIATAYTRYMYLPVIFVFPLLLAWTGYRQKNNRATLTAIVAGLVFFVALAPLLVQNYMVSGDANNHWSKGFYFKNLLALSPIFWDTFLDKGFFIYQLSAITHISYEWLVRVMIFSNYLIIIVLIIYFLKALYSNKAIFTSGNTYNNFFILGGTISLSIIFLLAYTSLTNNLESKKFGSDYYWTYITESRYFIFVHFYLLIIVVYKCFTTEKKSILVAITRKLLLLLFLIETTHGLWVLTKSIRDKRESLSNFAEVSQRKALLDKLVSKSRSENCEPVFFLSYSYYFIAYTSLNKIKLCTDFENFDDRKLRLDKPTQVFFITRKNAARTHYNSFILKNQFELVEHLDSLNIYSKHLLPND